MLQPQQNLHLPLGALGVGPQVLGGVERVEPLAALLDAEHRAERAVGDLVFPLVLKQE